jgi:hypothetical protein
VKEELFQAFVLPSAVHVVHDTSFFCEPLSMSVENVRAASLVEAKEDLIKGE